MKKHNESKSIKGIRRSKGKFSCTIISFTLIFVMLFCISASAEMTTITVKDQNGNNVNINTEIETITEGQITNKSFILQNSEITRVQYAIYYNIFGEVENTDILTINKTTNGKIEIKYETKSRNITENSLKIVNEITGETVIERNETNGDYQIQTKWDEITNPIVNNDYSEYITIVPPVYEGFIGNARGLFDMLFESIQSIFNWLVSPNVIVFFGLGIILSLTTIGILIARRFFWGR